MKKITKAILPVAGMGTRFLPATKAQPKEMLPIYDTPAIQFIVEDAVSAGIEDIIIVTGRNKRAIEDHFDSNFELEYSLAEKNKMAELEMVRSISRLANIAYVRQPEPLGDGHAILCAEKMIGSDEPVVVLFGDDLVFNTPSNNAVHQLLETYYETGDPVVLLEKVDRKDTSKYGIVDLERVNEKRGFIKDFVEKPSPESAPSDLAAVGKYIITPDLIRYLKLTQAGGDGEIRLANAFIDYLNDRKPIQGRILEGVRYDTGDKLGFLKATLHVALEEGGEEVKKSIQKFVE